MALAISRARPSRSGCGTTSLASPAATAWLAPRKSPVKLICRARERPTASGSRTDRPQPGSTPTRACVSAKTARSEQMTMSQLSTSSRPPVTAAPLTAAITGLEIGRHGACGPEPSPAPPRSSDVCWPTSLRSTPAQKAGSAPVSTTARMLLSASAVAIAACRAASSSPLMALRARGRFSVTVATASAISSRTTGSGPPSARSVMGPLVEGLASVRIAVARQPQDAFADDVALDLARTAGDAQDLAGQERLGRRGRVSAGTVLAGRGPGDGVTGLGLGGQHAEGHFELGVHQLADRALGPRFGSAQGGKSPHGGHLQSPFGDKGLHDAIAQHRVVPRPGLPGPRRDRVRLARPDAGPAGQAAAFGHQRGHAYRPAAALRAEPVVVGHHDIVEEHLAELRVPVELAQRPHLHSGRVHGQP